MTIFEVTGSDIEKLSDTDLRLLIGKLSEQELVVHGHSPVAVTYGGNQNAMDGGIDVRINSPKFLNSGFVPRPQTGFQVKAEDLPPSEIEKENAAQY